MILTPTDFARANNQFLFKVMGIKTFKNFYFNYLQPDAFYKSLQSIL